MLKTKILILNLVRKFFKFNLFETSTKVHHFNNYLYACLETDKILEEKDWQINLLNNIIAGLHGKVSDNKFKIEALEKQILDSGA